MFPRPIPIPEDVLHARKNRSRALVKIASIGIIIRLIIAIIELCGFFAFDSHALLLDALSTLADCSSTLILIFSIKLAERPPDANHPFGHGRYEPLAGLQLGIFLVLGGIGMFWQQLLALLHQETHPEMHPAAFVLPLIALLLLELCYRKMITIARREKSSALEADAYHFRIDGLNSAVALIALLLAALIPSWSIYFDRIGAMGIALFMVGVGIFNSKNNVNQLLDRTPEQSFFDLVSQAAKTVSGVKGTEKIRIQQYGPDAHIDIDIEVEPKLAVDEAHEISQMVRAAIQHAWPQVRDVIVHIEPFYENDHR